MIGRAQEDNREVPLFTAVFLSTHMHLMLSGPPRRVVAFIGFVIEVSSIRR